MARDNIYDQNLLKDWDKWEHKYDSQIHSEEDAIRFASEMIDSLHEPVTGFMDARAVQEAVVHAGDHVEGVGIIFKLDVDGEGNLRTNVQGKALPALSPDGYPRIEESISGSPAHKAGIRTGDQIESIDGQSTHGWTIEKLTSALHGKPGSSVEIVLNRTGTPVKLTLVRGAVRIPIVRTKHLPGCIGYLRLETFDRWDTAQQFQEGLQDLSDCDALVIDLRNNLGGFIHSALDIGSMLLEQGNLTTIEVRIPEHGYLRYKVGVDKDATVFTLDNGPLAGLHARLQRRAPHLVGPKPVVLLVNDMTASASELLTGALKDNGRVTVVGTKTFGKGIGQMFVPVTNGCRLRLTNQKLWSPNGDFRGDCGKTVANGVVPDFVVEARPGTVFGDYDNQLDVAVRIASQKLASKP